MVHELKFTLDKGGEAHTLLVAVEENAAKQDAVKPAAIVAMAYANHYPFKTSPMAQSTRKGCPSQESI